MAITKSAQKALRQNKKRRSRNIENKTKLKSLLKKVNILAAQKKGDEIKKILPDIFKSLDKTAKIGLIKKNTASRLKSRITKSANRNS